MSNICEDNRFKIIEKAKKDIIESTNIATSRDEMNVLDNFLFRCWQMGWLDKYDSEDIKEECDHDWVHLESYYSPIDMNTTTTYVCRKCRETKTEDKYTSRRPFWAT